MKAKPKYTLPLLALAATTLFSCSEESWFEKGLPDPAKELIDFTGTNGSITRAGLQTRADGQGELISFGANTKIVMRIKSEDKRSTVSDPINPRYTLTTAQAETVSSCDVDFHGNGDNQSKIGTHDHVSYHAYENGITDPYRYWDDAFGRYAQISVYAIAVPGKEALAETTLTKGTTEWFEEDAENEKFTWTLALTQNNNTIADQDICFSNNIRKRNPIQGGDQDDKEKGVFRFYNNNGTWSFKEMIAGRMEWTPKTSNDGETVGKFDQGNLIFHHALSKVTINLTEAQNTTDSEGNITEDKGFDNKSYTDFAFTTGNVELLDFPYTGTFDIASGKWTSRTEGKISELFETTALGSDNKPTEAKTTRTVTGLVLPDKVLKNDNKNALHFVIDNNDYYVTCDQIAKAIQTYYGDGGAGASDPRASELKNFTTMKQGDHYVINITVAKTKIENITAQLVDWEKVETNPIEPSNAYVTFELESRTGNIEDGNTFNLYRAEETADLNPEITGNDTYYNSITKFGWGTGYIAATTNDAASSTEDHAKDKATKNYENSKWKTEWFWPNNKTYYHFRTVGNTEGNATTPSDVIIYKHSSKGDYYKITSGTIEGSNYKDYTWGAPFNKKTSDSKFFYSTNKGFDAVSKDDASEDGATPSQSKHQIYKAIGAADPATYNINMIMFHMTSQITVKVTTTDDESRVILGDQENDTKVELLHFYKDGVVRVGNGLVAPDETTVKNNDEFKCYTSEHVAFDGTTTPKTTEMSVFKYGVVPQPLKFTNNSTDYTIGLRITTKDGNQYVINDISAVYATVSSENLNIPYTAGTETYAGKFLINRWYPGYKYTYTVTLKKTGIESITAQLVDWETVKGDLGTITLEK